MAFISGPRPGTHWHRCPSPRHAANRLIHRPGRPTAPCRVASLAYAAAQPCAARLSVRRRRRTPPRA
uniref:Uncharacterized protein n=1 Tax=Setaria italica TaxID=4555 RepID=K4ANK4_SETIT